MTTFNFTAADEIQDALNRLIDSEMRRRRTRVEDLLERFVTDNFGFFGRFIAAYGEDPDRFVLEDRTRFDGTLVFRDAHTGRYTVG